MAQASARSDSSHHEEYRWLAAILAITALTMAGAVAAGARAGVSAIQLIFSQEGLIWTAGIKPLFFATIGLIVLAIVSSRNGSFARLRAYARDRFGTPALAAATIGPILLVQLLVTSFSTLKMLMPLFRPFAWDDRLAVADRALFLGHDPWRLTDALFGPAATRIIDSAYVGWMALLFTAITFFAFFGDRYTRARFFIAFSAACLLIGVIGAYVFASAGPCYAFSIGAASAPDFAELMDKLHQLDAQKPLFAVQLQKLLWDANVSHHYALGMGISAAPSMHNAVALLYYLAVRRMGPAVRIACGAFVAIVFIGSIHLGWHYAVDGLLAFVMMAAIWKAAGLYLDWCGYSAAVGHSRAVAPALGDALPLPA